MTSKKADRSKHLVYCSFCGKHQDEAQFIIAGPGGVFICDECVELCRDLVGEMRRREVVRGKE